MNGLGAGDDCKCETQLVWDAHHNVANHSSCLDSCKKELQQEMHTLGVEDCFICCSFW